MYRVRGLGYVDPYTPCESIVLLANAGIAPPAVTMVPGPGGIPIPDQQAVAGLARWTYCTQGQIVTPKGFTDCGNGVFVGQGASCPAAPAPPSAAPTPPPAAAPSPAPPAPAAGPAASSGSCWGLFGGGGDGAWEYCIGPIGSTTLFLGLGVVVVLGLFRGKR